MSNERRFPSSHRPLYDAVKTRETGGRVGDTDWQRQERAREICRSKVHYASKVEAKKAALKRTRDTGIEMNAYACPVCNGFHITKIDPQDMRVLKRNQR
jgi:hypothetical protein